MVPLTATIETINFRTARRRFGRRLASRGTHDAVSAQKRQKNPCEKFHIRTPFPPLSKNERFFEGIGVPERSVFT
jgi:hypothetical protein